MLAATGLLTACGGGSGGNIPPTATAASVGEKIFFDSNLSDPGGMSCATCHDPDRAFTDAHALAIGMGVSEGVIPGRFGERNAPSILYSIFAPDFGFSSDGPLGGQFHDGRATGLSAQAGGPPLNPVEMNNADKATYVAKIRNAVYAEEFKRVWGANVFDNVDDAYSKIAASIAAFEQKDARFAPFSSKFDYWRAGKAQLSERELDGFRLFNDPNKGNCAACHPSNGPDARTPPLFTDFTYDALGVPRNAAIPANADPAHFDLGLCARPEISDPTLCGKFKVPTLRNVALTSPYFHNGKFANLRDVIKFYVTRDTQPELWYPRDANGQVVKFDDLPDQYKANVNLSEAPYNRQPGDAPALNDDEIDRVVEFLGTLTDGYILP